MDDPATANQLSHLKQLGYEPDRALSRVEAAQLIGDLRRHHGFHPTPGTHQPAPLPAAKSPIPVAESDAQLLRASVVKAKQALADAAMDRRADPEHALAWAIRRRQEFWMDTCREPSERQAHPVSHSSQIWELYMKHGCCLVTPTHAQVQEVLDALDAALPSWDRDHAELFYRTLELNFPELVRHL